MSKDRKSRVKELNEQLIRLKAQAKLDSWNSFVKELQIPGELHPALLTQRTELLKLVEPRALSKEECKVLYELIGGLMETNRALADHASNVSNLVSIWSQAFKQLDRVGRDIEHYAAFRHHVSEEEEQVA